MVQSRNVYRTGQGELDRILDDIGSRLDVLEGLRPDLTAGYYNLDSDKIISTSTISDAIGSAYVATVDEVTIDDTGILVSSANGNSIVITGEYIEIKDQNGEVTHRIGTFTV